MVSFYAKIRNFKYLAFQSIGFSAPAENGPLFIGLTLFFGDRSLKCNVFGMQIDNLGQNSHFLRREIAYSFVNKIYQIPAEKCLFTQKSEIQILFYVQNC